MEIDRKKFNPLRLRPQISPPKVISGFHYLDVKTDSQKLLKIRLTTLEIENLRGALFGRKIKCWLRDP